MQNHNCNLFISLPSMTSSNESYIFIHQEIAYIPLFEKHFSLPVMKPHYYCRSFSEADNPFQFYCGHTLINPQGGFKVLHFNTKLCLWSLNDSLFRIKYEGEGNQSHVTGTVRGFALFVMLQ